MIVDFLLAVLIAALLTAIFAGFFRGHRFGAGLIMFFAVLLLATWAGGIWISPFGPLIRGVSWISFVLVGLLFALILTILLPPLKPGPEAGKRPIAALAAMDWFFWVTMACFAAAIAARYMF
jgi:hypothetical protein